MAVRLENHLLFRLQDVYDRESIVTQIFRESKLQRPPSQSELVDQVRNSDPQFKRMQSNILNGLVGKFYQSLPNDKLQQGFPSITVTNRGEGDASEPQPSKKPKIDKPISGVTPIEEEAILRFTKLADLGAIESIMPQLESTIYMPLKHGRIFEEIGVQPPRGVLITGPTGSGKSALGQALCRDLNERFGLQVFVKHATELVGSLSGESERNIRSLFQGAVQAAPSVVFIDEIDVIAGSRDRATKEMERRVVSQMMGSLDQLPNNIFVIAASSHPDYLDPSLRRSGRFDKEVGIGVPNDQQREHILRVVLRQLKVSAQVDPTSLARRTPGYVAADLQTLCREAATNAVKRIADLNSQTVEVNDADFEIALKHVQPTAKREGFAVIPDVTWNDIGSLETLRQDLEQCIVLPIQNPEIFEKFAVRAPAGVLLWGPPGCGKTLLAKAVANASRANFIAVKGPELLNKYFGESEKAIRNLFSRARASQPCVIFFDEIDAICPIRGGDGGGGQVTERVVNQLLTELDGFEDRKQVFIIAATNRPDILDPAILRPGRIDRPLYVPLPDERGKVQILQALSRRSPMDENVDFTTIVSRPEAANLTGADLSHLLTQAALDSIILGQSNIRHENFIQALTKVKASIQDNDRKAYERLREKWERN